jgi:uncharacterized protein YbjT (DUF2867 family)
MNAEGRDGVVAVTGATGRQGGAVARALLADGRKVRVLTRRPSSEAARALVKLGAEAATCDLRDRASTMAALHGASAVFLITTPYESGVEEEERQGRLAIKASRDSGVRQIVYSSVAAADRMTGVPHFESKGRVERFLGEAGIPLTTVLRPTFFMDMFLGDAFRRGLERGGINLLIEPETRIAMIAVEDIAAFAVRAFGNPADFDGHVIDLAGDYPSMTELAAALSEALDIAIEYRQVDESALDDDVRPKAGTQRWLEEVGWQVDRRSLAPYGIPLTDVGTWARRHHDALLPVNA